MSCFQDGSVSASARGRNLPCSAAAQVRRQIPADHAAKVESTGHLGARQSKDKLVSGTLRV